MHMCARIEEAPSEVSSDEPGRARDEDTGTRQGVGT
jgi:hypothetical protein